MNGHKDIADYIIDFLIEGKGNGVAIKVEKLKELATEKNLATHLSKETVATYYEFSMWEVAYQGNKDIVLYFFNALLKQGYSIDSNKLINFIKSANNTNQDLLKIFSEKIIVGIALNVQLISDLISIQQGNLEIIDDILLNKDVNKIKFFVTHYPEIVKEVFKPENISL